MTETPAEKDRLPVRFEVGEWLVDRGLNEIRQGEKAVRLEPKVMRLLVRLAERAGETVSREELLDSVWPEQHVIEGVLTRAASQLRQALRDSAREPAYLQTIPKRGYRLIAPVRHADPSPEETVGADTPGRRWLWLAAAATLAVIAAAIVSTRAPPETAPEIGEPPSIAVLPLLNLAEDPTQDYFSLGMAEALTAELARVSGLRVVSRTSAMRFQETSLSLGEIARELGVSALVEGSVLLVEDRVRITVQLVEAETDEHLWAESYESDLADVLTLQREIARDVARESEVHLTPREEARLTAKTPVDAELLRLYLRGRYHWSLRTPQDLARSRAYFEQLIGRDPAFAPAWAGLADTLVQLYGYSYLPPQEAFAPAREAAREALRLDDQLAAAHASLGLVEFNLEWDAQAAEAAFRRAIELEPSYAPAHQWYSELLSLVGRHEEALARIELAWGLDPFSPIVSAARGQRLNAAGRYSDALARFDEALEMQPRLAWVHRERAFALARLGRPGEALEARLEEMRLRDLEPGELESLEAAAERFGMTGFWRWHSARLERMGSGRWIPAVLVAEAHAGLGDRESALDWLERAADERGLYLPHLLRSPAFDGLRTEPRLLAIERRFDEAVAGVHSPAEAR